MYQGRRNPWDTKDRLPPVTSICIQCGTVQDFYGKFRSVGAKRRFCSQRCHGLWLRGHPEELHQWRGGSVRYPYYGPMWRDRKKEVRDRDDHTCQDCGRHQFRPLLDVHHIRPLRLFGEDYEQANDPINLVTLCKGCHTLREMHLDKELGTSNMPPHVPYRRRWGELHAKAKLTEAQVAEIRARYSPALRNGPVLAREFGIVNSNFYAIIRGQTWRDVEPLPIHQPRLL